ncbi:MAG: hypothetical protein ACTHJK_01000 [Sphingomicrobium sp.]
MTMFRIIGLLVGLYALFAMLRGEVIAKSGVWGRTISRRDEPANFWMTVAIYGGLAVALETVF